MYFSSMYFTFQTFSFLLCFIPCILFSIFIFDLFYTVSRGGGVLLNFQTVSRWLLTPLIRESCDVVEIHVHVEVCLIHEEVRLFDTVLAYSTAKGLVMSTHTVAVCRGRRDNDALLHIPPGQFFKHLNSISKRLEMGFRYHEMVMELYPGVSSITGW